MHSAHLLYTQTASPNLKSRNNETTSSPRTTSHDASPTRRRPQSTAIPADISRFCISNLQNPRPALRNSPRPASSAPDRARIRCATTAAAETQRSVPAYLRCVALRCVKLKFLSACDWQTRSFVSTGLVLPPYLPLSLCTISIYNLHATLSLPLQLFFAAVVPPATNRLCFFD